MWGNVGFIVKVNPQVKRSSEIIDVLVKKLNSHDDNQSRLDWYFEKYGLSEFLKNDKVANLLFKLIRHPLISSHEKKDLLMNINTGKFPIKKGVDTLIRFILDREENFHRYDWDSRYDWQVIDELISQNWKVVNIDDYNVLKLLIQNSKINYNWNKDIISIFFYEAWKKIIILLANSPNPNIFLEDEKIPKDAKKLFAINCSIENLFKTYRTEYKEMIRYIVYHLRYKKLPYYVKDDKKLYAVCNGKEISTVNINQNILDNSPEIKKALKNNLSQKE